MLSSEQMLNKSMQDLPSSPCCSGACSCHGGQTKNSSICGELLENCVHSCGMTFSSYLFAAEYRTYADCALEIYRDWHPTATLALAFFNELAQYSAITLFFAFDPRLILLDLRRDPSKNKFDFSCGWCKWVTSNFQ